MEGATFGAVLAGGTSSRFGSPKALAEMGGRTLAEHSVAALRGADLPVGVVTGDPGIGERLGVPSRPDIEGGLGPLGGLWTALEWAGEMGKSAVFLLACDMPFVPPELVRLVMSRRGAARAVAPVGSDGVQPLCALYTQDCLPEVRARARSADRSLHGLLEAVDAERIPAADLAKVADLSRVFWNVNTVVEGERAAVLLSETPDYTR